MSFTRKNGVFERQRTFFLLLFGGSNEKNQKKGKKTTPRQLNNGSINQKNHCPHLTAELWLLNKANN